MSLGISGATVGYDVEGLTSLINEINTQVIPDAATAMRNAAVSARTEIDTVWVGTSAEAFKDKITSDTETLCKTLEELGDAIESELNQVGANVEGYDDDLAEQIKSWD